MNIQDEKLILEYGYKNDYKTRVECERLIRSLDYAHSKTFKDLDYSTSQTSPLQTFKDLKHVLFTNYLKERERRHQTLGELQRLGFNPQRVEAIVYDPPQFGIACTHIKCLEIAKAHKWSHVLICEDNVMFRQNIEFIHKKVNQFLSRHPDWDVILIEGILVNGTYLDDASARVSKAHGTIAYIVRQEYYDVLLHNFRQSARNIYHKQPNSNLDIHWHSLQARDHWYAILPLLALPRPLSTDRTLSFMQLIKKYCMNITDFPEREQLSFNEYPFQIEIDFQKFEQDIPGIQELLVPIVKQSKYRELDYSSCNQSPLHCFQDIQNVLYINLDDRPDRRQEIESELRRIGFNPQRIRGFRIPGNGPRGCNLSHIKCLELAKSQNWSHVFICEDDALFRTDISFVQRRIDTFLQRHTDWDVITLGPNIREGKYIDDCSARIYKSWCAAAYIVRQEYYDVLLHLFKNATEGNIIADATWSHLSTRDKWYTVLPLLVVQRPSKSDLEDLEVDYRQLLIQNSFKHIEGYNQTEKDKYLNIDF